MRNVNNRFPRGTSLIEVILVMTIISILISMAVPSFHRALEQSRADLAGANLRAIWSAERAYWLEYRTYATDLSSLQTLGLIDPAIISSQTFYSYQITSAGASAFTASATRTASTRWNGEFGIDETGVLTGALSASGELDIVPGYQ